MSENEAVKQRQLEFLVAGRAGCLFAAAAARDPGKFGWVHRFPKMEATEIDAAILDSVADAEATTLSLLFPEVKTSESLCDFLKLLKTCSQLTVAQIQIYEGSVCFGFRAKVGHLLSYVTGFGDFPFLPKTRQAPCVEIVMRVKPRPTYEFSFKEAPPGVVHLADLDMRGMRRDRLWQLWHNSFTETQAILGAPPDLRSAAKTTFCLPVDFLKDPHDPQSLL